MSQATCPFCGLLCDDLAVRSDGAALVPSEAACEKSRAAFATLGRAEAATAAPRVAGKAASGEAALAEAARLLARAKRPFIGGLGTDVAGMRAALALARRLGAVIDHAGSQAKYRNLHVLQESGWITTTLAEAKNRADLYLLIGEGWRSRYPRFVERLLAPGETLYADRLARKVILLDSAAARAADALPAGCERLALGVPAAALPSLLAVLNALVDERPVDSARLSGVAPDLVARALDWLRAARYGVFCWSAADLEFPHAELALQSLARLIRALNRSGRYAALPLAGSDGELTANAVQTWHAGVAFPASYANGTIDFDPHRYAMQNVLARGEADCLVWISSLERERTPPEVDLPTLLLGRADMTLAREPAVFIPVATPGIDAAGHLLRSDKTVSLRLPRLRNSGLPSAAQALEALLAQLEKS